MVKKLEILAAIGRVRRAMPRNVDVMLICDELEAVTKGFVTVTKPFVTGKGVGRPPLGKRVMTDAERQRRYRARERW